MHLAITEAKKSIGLTSPNPPVGAVLVKEGKLLGKGWHTRAGQPHAEREAIADALKTYPATFLSGATIYVTLEPCCSHGRTPPCTDAIIQAGITRVVYGARDPNPKHAGRADDLLMRSGIQVESGICDKECGAIIRAFSKVQQTGLPWVILKSAMSLDGRTTRPPGESQWLSSEQSRQWVQNLRHQCDAILTGGNTLRADNPALTIRTAEGPTKEQPWRMVVTRGSERDLPTGAQVFTDEHAARTLVQENGDIKGALLKLKEKGCNTVLVEAGGRLMGALLSEGLADEVAIFYTPLLTGGPDAGFSGLPSRFELHEQKFTRIGDDILLRALISMRSTDAARR